MTDCLTMRPYMWSRKRRLNESEVKATIAFWRTELHVSQEVQTERIHRLQVTGESGRPGETLVGVVYDHRTATIYHTRRLTAEDIIHELLHVANPGWPESSVVYDTDRLISKFSRLRPHRDTIAASASS